MSDAIFAMAIREAVAQTSEQAVADLLMVSIPTVGRWMLMRNLPAASLRMPLVRHLAAR